mmetsp:Transcript_32108/g.83573  ORF Transcript_32108/g.83573 Transcript_32108/m.83573 type:complete len:97 (+) Transcript_32108:110-400(+)
MSGMGSETICAVADESAKVTKIEFSPVFVTGSPSSMGKGKKGITLAVLYKNGTIRVYDMNNLKIDWKLRENKYVQGHNLIAMVSRQVSHVTYQDIK